MIFTFCSVILAITLSVYSSSKLGFDLKELLPPGAALCACVSLIYLFDRYFDARNSPIVLERKSFWNNRPKTVKSLVGLNLILLLFSVIHLSKLMILLGSGLAICVVIYFWFFVFKLQVQRGGWKELAISGIFATGVCLTPLVHLLEFSSEASVGQWILWFADWIIIFIALFKGLVMISWIEKERDRLSLSSNIFLRWQWMKLSYIRIGEILFLGISLFLVPEVSRLAMMSFLFSEVSWSLRKLKWANEHQYYFALIDFFILFPFLLEMIWRFL